MHQDRHRAQRTAAIVMLVLLNIGAAAQTPAPPPDQPPTGGSTGSPLAIRIGDANADQLVASDVDGGAIGFGVPGSTVANKTIVESTAGVTHTFFRDPKIGGIQFMTQYSHVRRTPFSVPAGTPADAAVNMLYFNVPAVTTGQGGDR